MTKPRRWKDKLLKPRQIKRVQLEAPFAGIPAGSWLLVGTPQLIADYIQKIPPGEQRSVARLRRDFARTHRADALCPVSTGIFLRMVAEAAWEQVQDGAAPSGVLPFWRVVAPNSPLARKLACDAEWLRQQREAEGLPAHSAVTAD